MYLIKCFLIFIFLVFCLSELHAQARAYVDQAQAYNKILLDKEGSKFTRVGKFKVTGSPYLFGTENQGQIFLKYSIPFKAQINYNLFEQQVEFYPSTSSKTTQVQNFDQIDSFYLQTKNWENVKRNYVFVNANQYGIEEKFFFELVFEGPKYALLKRYSADLAVVTTNYIDSDLRQFEVNIQYYYLNKATNKTAKIKLNSSQFKKAFKPTTTVIDTLNFQQDPELAAIKVFEILNQ